MPKEDVTKAYQNAIAKMIPTLPTEAEVNEELNRQLKLDKSLGFKEAMEKATSVVTERKKGAKADASVGGEVFKEIQNNPNLTPEEKQQVCCMVAESGVTAEVEKNKNAPNNLLRLDSPTSNFISAYMEQNGQEYYSAVRDTTIEGAIALNSNKDLTAEEKQLAMGSQIVKASQGHLDKLSPNARQFLQSALSPSSGNLEAMNIAVVGTLNLRGSGPVIQDIGFDLSNNPETKDIGKLISDGNKVSQSYINRINKEIGGKSTGKQWDDLSEKLRTNESIDQSKKSAASIIAGGKAINVVAQESKVDVGDEQTQRKMEALRSTAKRLAERREAYKSPSLGPIMKAGDDRIKALTEKRERLANNQATGGEKFTAFFKHGMKGVKGEITKIDQEIAATKKAMDEVAAGISLNDRKDYVATLKDGADLARSKLAEANSTNSGIGDLKKIPKEEHQARASLAKELNNKLKGETKVQTVREKMEKMAAKSQKTNAPAKKQTTGHSM